MSWTCYKSDSDLMDLCHIKFLLVNQQLRSVILATIFNNEYGDELFNALCKANDIELGFKINVQLKIDFSAFR